MRWIRKAMRRALQRAGYDVIPYDPQLDFDDFDLRTEDAELGILSRVGPFTMTSRARISALCRCVEYVVTHRIPGDIVECGVWKGGSMMAVALRLMQLNAADRRLHLFDTFEGMTPTTPEDADYRGRPADELWQLQSPGTAWLKIPLEEVRNNLRSTGYPEDLVRYVPGPVEQTLPAATPAQISILRLDTDWYASTKTELEALYPRLAVGGVLILDDYGYWKGQRQAVDEYIAARRLRLLLTRIDHSCRLAVKLDPD